MDCTILTRSHANGIHRSIVTATAALLLHWQGENVPPGGKIHPHYPFHIYIFVQIIKYSQKLNPRNEVKNVANKLYIYL